MMVTKEILKKESGVTTEKLVLTLNKTLLERIRKKSKKLGYTTPQQLIYDIIIRDINRKKVGGRPLNHLGKVENVVTRKKVLVLKGGGIFPNKL